VAFENISKAISFWGGIASLLALIVMCIEYSRRLYKKIQSDQGTNEKIYSEIELSIKSLSEKATSHQKRQEIFMYSSSLLDRGRNIEIRLRINAAIMHIISFITFAFACISIRYKSDYIFITSEMAITFVKLIIIALMLVLLFINVSVKRKIGNMSKLNDSFFNGYIDVIHEHIENKFNA